MSEMKPVAYATFCDAWITDHTADPIRAEQWREDGHDVKELHIIPADQVLVPRELLEELLEAAKDGAAHKGEYLSKKYGEPELFAKFDTLLHP